MQYKCFQLILLKLYSFGDLWSHQSVFGKNVLSNNSAFVMVRYASKRVPFSIDPFSIIAEDSNHIILGLKNF